MGLCREHKDLRTALGPWLKCAKRMDQTHDGSEGAFLLVLFQTNDLPFVHPRMRVFFKTKCIANVLLYFHVVYLLPFVARVPYFYL